MLAYAPTALAGHAGINGVNCSHISVQDAINAAGTGDTVWIAQGEHDDPGFVVGKRLTLERGTASCEPGGTANAVLDFQGVGHAEIEDELGSVTLNNLTLYNGVGTEGGNLLIGAGSRVEMGGVGVFHGTASGEGGGISVGTGATVIASGLVVWYNSAASGGGIYAAPGSDLTLAPTESVALSFSSNDASDMGGRLLATDAPSP